VENVAVLFAEGTGVAEGGECEVQELGSDFYFQVVLVQDARAIDVAEDSREPIEEDALVVGVFLVCADWRVLVRRREKAEGDKLMSGAAAKGKV